MKTSGPSPGGVFCGPKRRHSRQMAGGQVALKLAQKKIGSEIRRSRDLDRGFHLRSDYDPWMIL